MSLVIIVVALAPAASAGHYCPLRPSIVSPERAPRGHASNCIPKPTQPGLLRLSKFWHCGGAATALSTRAQFSARRQAPKRPVCVQRA